MLHYLSLDIWPNPNETVWPRDLGASVWCPPDVTISFTHRGHEVSIELTQNDMLDVDTIPLAVREGGKIVRAPKMTVTFDLKRNFYICSRVNLHFLFRCMLSGFFPPET